MLPEEIYIADFTYPLPPERIALVPQANRAAAKLLVYKESVITESDYLHLVDYLPKNALLVFNETKVLEARILFQKESGGVIEIFCLEHHEKYRDVSNALSQTSAVQWKCLVGGVSKWKPGQRLEKKITTGDSTIMLRAEMLSKEDGYFLIEFSWSPASTPFAAILQVAGAIPLPPYIKREVMAEDNERYQTIYAKHDGSVAAPTAGLHFTDKIFASLEQKNIKKEFLTLHVGAGTFMPVKTAQIKDHQMHGEYFEITYPLLKTLLENTGEAIVAVGTTSLRTLESIYWAGVQLVQNKILAGQRNPPVLHVGQWEPYIGSSEVTAKNALQALIDWMEQCNIASTWGKTQLLIAPGYSFKIVNGLITNFHQPGSTLLLLVAALVGDDWKKIYDYALSNDFRFLSYGDGSLLWCNAKA